MLGAMGKSISITLNGLWRHGCVRRYACGVQGNDWHTAEFASGYLTTALSILPMLDSLAAVATAGSAGSAGSADTDKGDKADKAGDSPVPTDGSFYAPSYNIFAKVRVILQVILRVVLRVVLCMKIDYKSY